jgi:hypothetical protein
LILRLLHLFDPAVYLLVIEHAEELVETVGARQKFVAISEVVFAKLARGVAKRLKRFRNRDVAWLNAGWASGDAHF